MNRPHKITLATQHYLDNLIKKINIINKSGSYPEDFYSTLNSIYRGRFQCKSDNCFHLTVSEQNIDRALIFLDTLVQELDRTGFKILSINSGPVIATKDNEIINFSLSEGYKYQAIEKYTKRSRLDCILYPNRMPVATGKLTFVLSAEDRQLRKSWTDRIRLIESELPAILNEFVNLISKQQKVRIDKSAEYERQKEESRLFKEKESDRYFEQSIYNEALQESQLFKKHEHLYAYLNYLETECLGKHGSIDEQLKNWVSTVRRLADEKSPVTLRLKKRILI